MDKETQEALKASFTLYPNIFDRKLDREEWIQQGEPYVWQEALSVRYMETEQGTDKVCVVADSGRGFYALLVNDKVVAKDRHYGVLSYERYAVLFRVSGNQDVRLYVEVPNV